MAKRRPWCGVPWESRGFALIVVLWAFVLISLIVTHLTASGRTELRIAGNLAANAAAQAAADGAIYRAIFNVLDPRQDEHWDLDGGMHELQIADTRVALRLENEAARVNPNLASTPLLQALLEVVSGNPEQAASVAVTIAEWVGAKKGPQPLTGSNADYGAAGMEYRPPREPFESIEELARVRGVTPDLFQLLRPHLTLF